MADLDERVAYLEHRAEAQLLLIKLDLLDKKIDQRAFAIVREVHERTAWLDQKMSRQFMWLIGAGMTTLLAIAGAVVAAMLTG